MRVFFHDINKPNEAHWVRAVAAVRAGLITLEEACERYRLSVEEFLSWQRLIDKHGMRGLRTTRLQQYRRNAPNAGGLISEPVGGGTIS